jgi:16S rRNA (guanine966-N2)-methyltransferase
MNRLRITGGEWGGRWIEVPARGVRPTQDRVRQALFNALAARIPGCRLLDLFAGSGAVGLEALSRGARSVTWVERDPGTLRILKGNLESLRPGSASPEAEVVPADATAYLRAGVGAPADFIFADPPYEREGRTVWTSVIFGVLGKPERWLAPGGLVILEEAEDQPLGVPPGGGWLLKAEKRYGGTRLRFWGYPPAEPEKETTDETFGHISGNL